MRARRKGGLWEAEIACLLPERLLEEARRRGIAVLRASVPEEGRLLVRLRGGDMDKLVALCERYRLSLRRRAVGRRLVPLRLLLPAAAGFAAGCVLLLLLTGRVWSVEACCPQGGDPRPLLAAMEDLGVTAGAQAPDPDVLARRLEAACPQYSHISVRLTGVTLLAEAYPLREPPAVYDLARARDLVARCDAVVDEITVRSGQAAVRRGDVVRRGQTLILGEERSSGEETRGIGALGEVTGRVYAYGEASAPLVGEERRYTGRASVSAALCLFGWERSIARGEEFACAEIREERLPVGGMFLPLLVRRVTAREYEALPAPLDEAAVRAQLEARAMAQALARLPSGAEMIDKWEEYSMMEETSLRLRVCVEARVSLAAAREELYAAE